MIKKGDLLDELPTINGRIKELEEEIKTLINLTSAQNKTIISYSQKIYNLEVAVNKLIDLQPKEVSTSTPIQKRKRK